MVCGWIWFWSNVFSNPSHLLQQTCLFFSILSQGPHSCLILQARVTDDLCQPGSPRIYFRNKMVAICMFFVCLGFIVPLDNFSLKWRHHHYRWRAANYDLCSALMAIEQWGFFSMPHLHLLWQGASVYNGHLLGSATHTPLPSSGAVELSRPDFATYVFRGWDSNTQPSACGANALTHCATAAVSIAWVCIWQPGSLYIFSLTYNSIQRTFLSTVAILNCTWKGGGGTQT